MAARKRTGADDGTVQEQPRLEPKPERERKLRKERVSSPHDRCYSFIRWTIVVLILFLLILGLIYYFTRLHHTPEGRRSSSKRRGVEERGGGREGGKGRNTGSEKVEKNKKKTSTNKPNKEMKKKKKNEKQNGKKTQTDKKMKPTRSKGRSVPTVAMEDVRLLRRPVAVDDADRPYIIEILNGDNLLIEERYSEALEKFNEILKMFPQSPRGLFGKGETLAGLAGQKSSNKLLETAIEFYQNTANSILAKRDLKIAALVRLVDLCQERGKHVMAVTALEKLYSLATSDSTIANRLGAAYIKTGKYQKAETHFKKLLNDTPENAYAKAHLGYLLYRDREYEAALPLLMEGLRNDDSLQNNGRFYLYAGEALTRLGRNDEAYVLYSEAVSRDILPSLYQRSLLNEPDLRGQPWWDVEETGYNLQPLLDNLNDIRSEVIPALLGDARDPAQVLPLYSQGKKNAENCRKTPLTCSLLDRLPAATSCKHGETKFIIVPPNSHVPPHTAHTNTKLVVVMGLNLGENGGLEIRLANEKRVLKEGEILVFDDSFEQELWFNSPRPGLVLNIEVWHPDLTPQQRKRLHPIH